MSTVHGWRRFTVVRCNRTGEHVLKGQLGQHQHTNPSEDARCRGGTTGMWLTEEAKARLGKPLEERVHSDGDCPLFDCSCGYYGFRTYEGLLSGGHGYGIWKIVGHVTCLGPVILHTEGFRARKYLLDYILAPDDLKEDMTVWQTGGPNTSPLSETMPIGVAIDLALHTIGSVPILDKLDRQGCRTCIEVNWPRP